MEEKYYGCISNEQIKQLEECPNWSWKNTTINRFEQNYERWVHFYNKYNRRPKRISEDKEENKICNWQSSIRQEYKNKEKRLTDKMINLLNLTNGWKWEGR
jgi:hypothetical protein